MKAYHYDAETFEFCGISDAPVSPLETEVFLLPANATFLIPPECQEGFKIIFNEWTLEWVLEKLLAD